MEKRRDDWEEEDVEMMMRGGVEEFSMERGIMI